MKIEEIKEIFKLKFPDAAGILEGTAPTGKTFTDDAASLWLGFKTAWDLNTIWHIDFRDGKPGCSNCGAHLKNLNVKAAETGCFYCDEDCCKENVKQNQEAD